MAAKSRVDDLKSAASSVDRSLVNSATKSPSPGRAHGPQSVIDGFTFFRREHPIEGETAKYTIVGLPPGGTARQARLVMGILLAFPALIGAGLAIGWSGDNSMGIAIGGFVVIVVLWRLSRRQSHPPSSEKGRFLGVQVTDERVIVVRQPSTADRDELVSIHPVDDGLSVSMREFESFWVHGATIHEITVVSHDETIARMELPRVDGEAVRLALADAGIAVRPTAA